MGNPKIPFNADLAKDLGLLPAPRHEVKISAKRLRNRLERYHAVVTDHAISRASDGGFYSSYPDVWVPIKDQQVEELRYEIRKLKATVYDNDQTIATYRLRFGDL